MKKFIKLSQDVRGLYSEDKSKLNDRIRVMYWLNMYLNQGCSLGS